MNNTNKEAVIWTPEQLAAISLKDRTLLVSAAAGSGKTAVLTERIIQKLTDKENPADISRFLIVTFTKAAANELKTRISKAISAAIAKDPSNKHLSRQLLLLGSAKICTIHSFCLDVIKKNLQALGLPKGISVSNDAEMLLYSREIMEEIIDEAFSGVFEEGFEMDAVVIDDSEIFTPKKLSKHDRLERLCYLYTNTEIVAKCVAGKMIDLK